MATKEKKKQKLRNNEYYNIQELFDDLYDKAKNKNSYKFYKLIDKITDERNIELAYRNIKKNTGSKTQGTNGHTIGDLANKSTEELVAYVRSRISNYTPHTVRRVEIPKPNGKTRPLGIPTIEDRLIQQCILQVLEPICEAKFHNHSYGFRPNRSTQGAIARSMFLAQRAKLPYVVDIDIKGFFDNVQHEKLMKQMWSIGIQDKQLLCVIGKMLKAPIEGVGVPNKGTPQGGILSPLLSNIVLNELDWWISGQWESFKTAKNYDKVRTSKAKSKKQYIDSSHKYRALKKTNMKEIYIVRYADDFKLFCRDYKTASKIFHATKQWLKERLGLEISEEKSKIVNLQTNYSEFLGFKLKLKNKNNTKVIESHVSDKAMKRIKTDLKEQIKKIQKDTNIYNVKIYNAKVLGLHNYYKIATDVNKDFSKISFIVDRTIYNRLRNKRSEKGNDSECFKKFYGKYNFKISYIEGTGLFPIAGIVTSPPMGHSQDICKYTEEGRRLIHKNQQSVSTTILKHLMSNPDPQQSVEYNDNRLSLYVGQNGICPISKEILEIDNMECHHKIPKSIGGTDEYSNLIYLKTEIHKLIHVTSEEKINKYIKYVDKNKNTLKKLNKLRILVGNSEIKEK